MRPCHDDRVLDGLVAINEHRQPDLIEDDPDPGVGQADPQGPSRTIEPDLVGDQHADPPARQVADVFEVEDDPARGCSIEQPGQGVAESSDRTVVAEVGVERGQDGNLVDDLEAKPDQVGLDGEVDRVVAGREAVRRRS